MSEPLKAASLDIRAGHLVQIETVVGGERMAKILSDVECFITPSEMIALAKIVGYNENEALDMRLDRLTEELTCFFSKCDQFSKAGKTRYISSTLLSTDQFRK